MGRWDGAERALSRVWGQAWWGLVRAGRRGQERGRSSEGWGRWRCVRELASTGWRGGGASRRDGGLRDGEDGAEDGGIWTRWLWGALLSLRKAFCVSWTAMLGMTSVEQAGLERRGGHAIDCSLCTILLFTMSNCNDSSLKGKLCLYQDVS